MSKHDPFAALVAKNAKKAVRKVEQQKKTEELKERLESQLGIALKELKIKVQEA